ncbi:hypothetical protein [Natronoglycomyces albus]|uniref:Uncharacterized protein n=1 Tax=Natronoglycomyces albus TaxID=2811108 RepID=A0A895XMH1_9ACTN|nr:hypothetical protein [Natronoglycomyces albus]QSB04962.1 hypothetical protein JQS30_14540 [Natronoglycomyces albus]
MAAPSYHLEYATSVTPREAIEFFARELNMEIVPIPDERESCTRRELDIYAYDDPPNEFTEWMEALELGVDKVLIVSFFPAKFMPEGHTESTVVAKIVAALKRFVSENDGQGYFTMNFEIMLGDFTGERPAFDPYLRDEIDYNSSGDFDTVLSDVDVRPLMKLP